MLTMTPGTASQLDDLLDAHDQIRQFERELAKRRQAVLEIKEKLAKALERLETTFIECKQKQGRLPFGDDAEAPPPAAKPSNGRPAKGKAVAGQSNWSGAR